MPFRENGTQLIDRYLLEVEEDAQILLMDFYNNLETKLADGGAYAAIRGLVNKHHEQAIRIAGTLAVFNSQIDNLSDTKIDKKAMKCGIELASYFAEEVARLVDISTEPEHLKDALTIANWIHRKQNPKGKGKSGYAPPIRELRQGPQCARQDLRRQPALRALTSANWLKIHNDKCHLHPKISAEMLK